MASRGEDTCAKNSDRQAQIRALNDRLRTAHRGGQMAATQGVCSLGIGVVPLILKAVSEFAGFTPDNDPYGEHDFGALWVVGHHIYWKIDYYDRDLIYGSPDPANPEVTTRVLTIMLASEY